MIPMAAVVFVSAACGCIVGRLIYIFLQEPVDPADFLPRPPEPVAELTIIQRLLDLVSSKIGYAVLVVVIGAAAGYYWLTRRQPGQHPGQHQQQQQEAQGRDPAPNNNKQPNVEVAEELPHVNQVDRQVQRLLQIARGVVDSEAQAQQLTTPAESAVVRGKSPRPPMIRPAHHGCHPVGHRDQLHREQNVDGGPQSSSNSAAHDRQSRSVSPMHPLGGTGSTGDASTAGGRRRFKIQIAAATAPRSVSPLAAVNWVRSPSPEVARHVNDYKNCVAPDPEQVRPSRRQREDTYKKLFGKQYPRTGAQSQQPRKQRSNGGDTYSTLFGPPPEERRRPATPKRDGNTHENLFGTPPPTFVVRRNRSGYQDSPDLLSHDPRATGPQADKLTAVKGRYSLRHQDTGEKLFGEAEPRSTPPPPRVSGVFPLEVRLPAPPSPASVPSSQPPAEPVSK